MHSTWNLVVIKEEVVLSGRNIFTLLNIVMKIIDIRFVIISDLEGAGINKLKKLADSLVEIDTLLCCICEVTQFDWCNFFLFTNPPNNIKEIITGDYVNSISNTTTTVRAVDDTYIYIYTPSDVLVKTIKENYNVESVDTRQLSDLSFPE